MNENLITLARLLAFHDWTYEYSDDYSQYCRGRDERAAINSQIKLSKDQGLAEEVDLLLAKYAPKD